MGQRPENESTGSRDATLAQLGRAYAAALLAGDEVGAEVAIRTAMEARLSTGEIDDEIIAPALWLIGRLWERGEISVADEHLATEISLRVLALQREAQRTSLERGLHRAMLAAPQGEQHVVALRMIGGLLTEAGYDVLMLGGDVPTDALVGAASRHEPDVICLTATMPGISDRLLLTIHELQVEWPRAGYVLGGRGLSPRVRRRPGLEVCRRVSDVVEAVDALVKRADMN
jgi:methanogenic corrinoid protein MtbC1